MTDNNEEKDKLIENQDPEQGEKKEDKPAENQNPQGEGENKPENKDEKKSGDAVAEKKEEGETIDFSIGRFFIGMLFEFIGTFLFICAVLLGSGPEATIISFWIIITIISPFSGGHVNPAVTFGIYIYEMKLFSGIPKVICYFIAQLTGGALALMFASSIKDSIEIVIFKHNIEYPEFMAEAFFTGTFIFVILYCCSKTTQVSDNRALNCIIIASWLYYAATSAAKKSVGALNPAILTVFSVYNANVKEGWWKQHKHDVWSTLGAHFGGALVFAIIFFIVEAMFPDPQKPESEKKDAKAAENNKDAVEVKA